MDKETLYIYETENESIEMNINYQKKHPYNCNKIFDDLCLNEVTTLKGRKDAVKRLFSYNYNVPIYINQDLIFFKVKNSQTLWINATNVYKVLNRGNDTLIIFNNGHNLKINKNFRTILGSYNKCLELINYKNGLFSV